MYNIGDLFVYRSDVCEVIDIKEKAFNNLDYYILIPKCDQSLKIEIPINSKYIRPLITKERVKEIISEIPKIKEIERNLNVRHNLVDIKYREFLNTGSYENLISIIKTSYLRNKELLESKKTGGDKEATFSKLAEQYLYTEFSIVLGMSYEDTKKYIMDIIIKSDSER